MQKWILPPPCLDHGLHVLKPRSFLPNRTPKMQERTKPNTNQNRTALWRMFSSNLRAPANRKTGFYANHNQEKKQEVGFIFAWNNSELWSLFKYSRVKLKNQKALAVDVLSKAYPMVPLSCRSNLDGCNLPKKGAKLKTFLFCNMTCFVAEPTFRKVGRRAMPFLAEAFPLRLIYVRASSAVLRI